MGVGLRWVRVGLGSGLALYHESATAVVEVREVGLGLEQEGRHLPVAADGCGDPHGCTVRVTVRVTVSVSVVELRYKG